MKFNRKKLRPASVGTFATINSRALNNVSSTNRYLENSISYLCEIEDTLITKRKFRSEKNLQVLVNDADLLFVSKKTPFEGIVEVEPVSIKRDSIYGPGILNILRKKKKDPFLMRVDSLVYISSEGATSILDKYSEGVKRVIKNTLLENSCKSFTWEGR